MNTIWSSADLKKMDKIILKRANLTTINNQVSIRNNRFGKSQFIFFAFDDICNELNRLIQYKDKEDISNTLNLINGLKNIEYSNPPRLIKFLQTIDTSDNSQIFIIFREILIQFEIIVTEVANKVFENLDNDELNDKIDKLYRNEITDEEILIKNKLDKIFNLTNGINESKLFKPLIDLCYNKIKIKLLIDLKNILTSKKTIVYQNTNYCRYTKKAKGV